MPPLRHLDTCTLHLDLSPGSGIYAGDPDMPLLFWTRRWPSLPMLSSPQLASHLLVESKCNCVSEDAPNPYLQ